ncbi:MAG: MoxR family ATPase [Gammaproteobacteria bacterium]|jgi:MoxR-like ATPase
MEEESSALQRLYENLAGVVLGNKDALLLTLATLLSKGHLLIEDAPGLGKTTLAKALARSMNMDFRRLQCTPDLTPSDITGISIFNLEEHQFHFHPGPVFTNILLADEINRATPRTQSALLEAMSERTVTIDRKTHQLDEPFMVVATQNPVEFSGTYPLPEAQLDRFLMRISLGYPGEEDEIRILNSQQTGHPLDALQAVMDGPQLTKLQSVVEKVAIHSRMLEYIAKLVRATRQHDAVRLGSSPRGSLALMKAGKALALLNGKKYVTPEIIHKLAQPVLGHRLIFRDSGLYEPRAQQVFFKELLISVPVPDNPEH